MPKETDVKIEICEEYAELLRTTTYVPSKSLTSTSKLIKFSVARNKGRTVSLLRMKEGARKPRKKPEAQNWICDNVTFDRLLAEHE